MSWPTKKAMLFSCTHYLQLVWASPVAQLVKNLPTMQETQVQSLGWEELLEKGMATHSSILWGLSGSSDGKASACNVEDLGSIPGLGRSPGEKKGYSLQYCGLENFMDCIVHGVTRVGHE